MAPIPTLSSGNTWLTLIPIVQDFLTNSKEYNSIVQSLSSDTIATDCSSDPSLYTGIVTKFQTVETQLITALNPYFTASLTAITSTSKWGDANPYFRVVASTPDGFGFYDTKAGLVKNAFDYSPFSSSNNACQICNIKDSAGNTCPDSHLTRIAFQQAAGQNCNGFTFEAKHAKGNLLNKEYRLCTKMQNVDWFTAGFFAIAFYNVKPY
jgi:hypothetical protein